MLCDAAQRAIQAPYYGHLDDPVILVLTLATDGGSLRRLYGHSEDNYRLTACELGEFRLYSSGGFCTGILSLIS